MQGVGFRATAVDLARRRGLVGWVRNESDGTVTVEVQGPQPQLDQFLDELARVFDRHIRDCRVEPLEPIDAERGFEVRR